MKTPIEKLRLPLSRTASAVVVFFLVFSTSRWEARAEWVTLALFTAGMACVAVASLGRMWCSQYIAGFKNRRLIVEGPYSTCRNPLYFFSAIGVLCIGLCTETLTFPLVLLGVMALYYPWVIRDEERRLRRSFGDEFDAYARRVPAYFPRLALFSEPATYEMKPAAYRRHMFSALWFVWIVGLIEFAEGLKELGWIHPFWSIY